MLKAGEILKNAIRINELTPQKETASSTYVLLGATKNAQNEPYIVEFVVNSYDNTLESVDVLYSANAKKESAARQAPGLTENPLSVTDSTISITQLLDLARDNFPDVLPESVLRHFGFDRRPDGKLGESALYSLKGSERDAELAELAKAIGISVKKAKDYIDSVNSVARMIADDRVRLDYVDIGLSPFVSNVEYGAVKLTGLTLRERAEAMASLAHPDFREELLAYARENFR